MDDFCDLTFAKLCALFIILVIMLHAYMYKSAHSFELFIHELAAG